MSILSEIQSLINRPKNVRIIEHFHPSGKPMISGVYAAKGGWLTECAVNNSKFTNCVSEHNTIYSIDGEILEGISPEQYNLGKYNGGLIIFSTDVNSIKKDDNKILNYIKQKVASIKNRLMKNKKLTDIIMTHNREKASNFEDGFVGGAFSIGNYFKGRYTDIENNKVFDENSTSIEMLGVPRDVLISIATDICKDFDQETVLLKDYNTNQNMLIDQKP